MQILVTGAAGFIGMHTARRLLDRGDEVVGVDNINPYYDPALKIARLEILSKYKNFQLIKGDIADRSTAESLFKKKKWDAVIHLAAQAGVRYSVTNPQSYVDSNLVGFFNILEGCRQGNMAHLVYASSSSVYGGNEKKPFSEADPVDHPFSLYAATKRANELMAHSYSHLYNIPVTGLRFFTVYGPWGRPDQSLFIFVKAILNNEIINLFNGGEMRRDFTYIEDIVESLVRVLERPASPCKDFNPLCPTPHVGAAPYRVFNVGNSNPVQLTEFITSIEESLGKIARKNFLPMQPGDVTETYANTESLEAWIGFTPKTTVRDGVAHFIKWYRSYYNK